jgi:predicted peptidase
MNSTELWRFLVNKASENQFEIHTIPQNNNKPKWFLVSTEDDSLIIHNSLLNQPSVELKKSRKINFKDFETVYRYYERWKNGEKGIRFEVSRLSRNTAYIFSLIDNAIKWSI